MTDFKEMAIFDKNGFILEIGFLIKLILF